MSKKQDYIYSLDAVRSMAMIGVMLFHMLPSKAPGGFLGVVTFLVLAGYLSMRAIMLEGATKNPLRALWSKIKKLIPSLIVMTFATLMVMTIFLSEYLPGMKTQAVASIFGVNNIVQIVNGESYFAAMAEVKPFTHIWALSLEIQFYALLLLTAGWLYRSEHKKWWVLLFAAMTVFSVYMMNALFTGVDDVTRIYYGPDTRLFSFLIGALGALMFSDKQKRVIAGDFFHSTLVFVLIFLSAACFFTIKNSEAVYRYIFVLYSVLQLFLIYLCSSRKTFAYQVLSSLPFRAMTARSYALYLCHFPVIKIFEKLMWGSNLSASAFVLYELAIVMLVTEFFYLVFKQKVLLEAKISKRMYQGVSALCLTAMTAVIFLMPYAPHGSAVERYEKLEALRSRLNIPGGSLDIGIRPITTPAEALTASSAAEATERETASNIDGGAGGDMIDSASGGASGTQESTNNAAKTEYTPQTETAAASEPSTTPAYIDNSADIETMRALFEEWKPEFPQITMSFEDYLSIRDKKITLIGDSISVMIAERFVQFFPNAQISAQVNRQSYHAFEFYNIMKSEGRIGDIVVLALGANGNISYSTFDEVRADYELPMLITTVILPWPVTESERNAEVYQYAESRSGVGVIQWNEMCKSKTWLLYDDGVHPKDSGAIAYSFVIMDAVYKALSTGIPAATESSSETSTTETSTVQTSGETSPAETSAVPASGETSSEHSSGSTPETSGETSADAASEAAPESTYPTETPSQQ